LVRGRPQTSASRWLTGANAYPLVHYEYAIISTKQANPEIAKAIKRFFRWAIAPDETK
jgi:phosphate transport system substrate-binding protein